MATGVPKGKLSSLDAGSIRLDYPGKKSAEEILRTPAAESRSLLSPTSESVRRLYFGENAGILSALKKDKDVDGKVRLVYIDPPFATKSVFHSRTQKHAYEDVLAGPEFLEFLRERLVLLHSLLAEDGALYLHLDDKMVFHAKLILDEVFGPSNFRNCITRKKCNPKNYTRRQFGNVADYILFYSKSSQFVWNKPVEPWTPERAKEYQYVDPDTGRRFMKVPVHAPGVRNGETGKPWRGMLPPPGKHWQYSPAVLDAMDARGEIFWSSSGNPRRKVYLDQSDGVGVQDIWLDFRDAHNQNVCITGYPTEKNPNLLKRIIEASSSPGDLVLDCFAGSGTTLAVAEELGRQWIGVDNSEESLRTILQRFQHGTKPMGDFASERATESKKKSASQVALFDQTDEPMSEPVPQERSAVTGFSLLASADLVDVAARVLEDAYRYSGEVSPPKSVKERAPYRKRKKQA